MGNLLSLVSGVLPTLILVAGVTVFILFTIRSVSKWYRKVGPGEALVRSGRGEQTIISGGAGFVIPLLHESDMVDLSVMTITSRGDRVRTINGIPVRTDWLAQVRVKPDSESIKTAARSFRGKTREEIRELILQTLAGNFREVLATLTPEQAHQDKETFGQRVVETGASEMDGMGLEVVSLNIQELDDDEGYFDAMGKPKVAAIQRDARIAEAEAKRDADIRASAALREAEEEKAKDATAIAEANKVKAVKQAEYDTESHTAKANADVAYDLQKAQRDAELVEREGAVSVMREEQAALAAEKAITVAEKRQHAEIIVPAKSQRAATIEKSEADAFAAAKAAEGTASATRTNAEADSYARKQKAEAHATEIREEATAQATATKERLTAEAEGNKALATADALRIRETGAAEAEAVGARLREQAEGERQLAEARAAQDEVNLRQETVMAILGTQRDVADAYAQAMVAYANQVTVTYVGNGNGDAGKSIAAPFMAIPGMAVQLNEAVKALTGQNVGDLMAQAKAIMSGETDSDAPSGEEGES